MAYSGRLGTDESQPGNIEPGAEGSWSDDGGYQPDAYQNDAFQVEGAFEDSFTVDAVLSVSQSASFTVNAVLSVSQTGSFTANAVIALIQTGSLSADAVLQANPSSSFVADAVTQATVSASLTADSFLTADITQTLTADAVISAVQTASFTADAILSVAQAGSFTADATLALSGSASFTADAVLTTSGSASFTSDAVIAAGALFGTAFQPDAFQNNTFQIAESFTVDAIIAATPTASFSADAVLLATQTASFTADAEIDVAIVGSGSFTANATIAVSQSTSFTADAVIVVTTRFYLNSTTSAGVSPAFESGWEGTSLVPRRRMGNPSIAVSSKIGTSGAAAGTSGTFDRLSGQFTSEPLTQATVITGFTGLLRASENDAAADMRSQAILKVVSGDGSTLIGIVTDFNGGALTDEWPISASQSSQTFPFTGSTNTAVVASVGDRIVIEVGFRLHNTSGSSFTGNVRWGYTDGGSDFTTVGETADLNPWFDIAATTKLLPEEDSFTADAWIQALITQTFTANAVIAEIYRSRHARTGPQHAGTDYETVHLISFVFDRYYRGQNLREFLVDMDARLTAMESGFTSGLAYLRADATIQGIPSLSFTADAYLQQPAMSFTADAVIA